jgi:hypothetical protein
MTIKEELRFLPSQRNEIGNGPTRSSSAHISGPTTPAAGQSALPHAPSRDPCRDDITMELKVQKTWQWFLSDNHGYMNAHDSHNMS